MPVERNSKHRVGRNIKKLREGAGRSVVEMVIQTEIARGYWYEIEAGTANVTIDVLDRIAAALNVDAETLWMFDARQVKPRRGRPDSADPMRMRT